MLLFAIVTWRTALYAGTMRRSGEVSMNLEFPTFFIIYLAAFCFLILTLTILEDLLNTIKLLMGKK